MNPRMKVVVAKNDYRLELTFTTERSAFAIAL